MLSSPRNLLVALATIALVFGACGGKADGAKGKPAGGDKSDKANKGDKPDKGTKSDKGDKPDKGEPKAPTRVQKVADLTVHDLASLQAAVKTTKGKATLVAVWATWCAPCIAEMPALAAFYNAHHKDGLDVIGLCVDDKAELGKKIQEVIDKVKVPFEMALLKPETDEAFFKGLGVEWDSGLPATIVFGADGTRKLYTRKALTEAFLKESVLPLLK